MCDGDHIFIHSVVVLFGRNGHRPHHLPVAGRERYTVPVEGHVRSGDAANGQRYVARWFRVEGNGVGVGVPLLNIEGGLGDRHPDSVVVRHGHRDAGGG